MSSGSHSTGPKSAQIQCRMYQERDETGSTPDTNPAESSAWLRTEWNRLVIVPCVYLNMSQDGKNATRRQHTTQHTRCHCLPDPPAVYHPNYYRLGTKRELKTVGLASCWSSIKTQSCYIYWFLDLQELLLVSVAPDDAATGSRSGSVSVLTP